jgi:hypothetical protein
LEVNKSKVQDLSQIQVAAVEFLHMKSSSSFEGSSSSVVTKSSKQNHGKIGTEVLIKAAKSLNHAA